MRISDGSSDVCSSDLVLGGIRSIVKFDRPDDYYEKLPATYEAMTAAEMDAAARKALRVDDLVYVVVGDAATVNPQLDRKSVVSGKSVSVRVGLGGGRVIKKKNTSHNEINKRIN